MNQPHLAMKIGKYDFSDKQFKAAQKLIPGGVNSPVRAFKSVEGHPVFINGAEGAVIQDSDGNQYVDYVGSWGPMILGHADKHVIEAVQNIIPLGLSFGAPTDRETCLVDFICDRHPSVEMARLVNSGTEATMSAIRLARGYTGKKRVIKFDGCYHGHGDSLLVAAGSGAATQGIPGSAGVPEELAKFTTVVPYNDLDALTKVFSTFDDIACVIVEPVAGNMGCIPPKEGFLQGIQTLCNSHNALFICDEVMTGFRVAKGSAQELYNLKPDLSCFGKIVGGGMPLAAYGGKKEIMEHLAPLGNVYQAGTLAGNPVAVTAGIATVEQLTTETYEQLEKTTSTLEKGMEALLDKSGLSYSINRVGSMLTLFFMDKTPTNFAEAQQHDNELFKAFFHEMFENGVYLPPSPYESWFISTAHTQEMIDHTLKAMENSLGKMTKG
jgi:glutamate-1-semialdehyde 2,1-aminomutase